MQQDASSSGNLPFWGVRLCRWLWRLPIYTALACFIAIYPITRPNDFTPQLVLAQWPLLLTGTCLLALAILIQRMGQKSNIAWKSKRTSPRNLEYLRTRYERMLTQSLDGATPLRVSLAAHSSAGQSGAERPTFSSIQEAYESAQQALQILGQPGAGKSTLLLKLALHLIEQAELDESRPLPFLVPLSSWDMKHPPTFVEQITTLYEVPDRLISQWVKEGAIVLLLDGLDKMDATTRANCIAAINVYHKQNAHPLVVCSGLDEDEMAGDSQRLDIQAVAVEPLTVEQVDSYLAEMGEPLATLRASLQQDATLQALATTPLLLRILIRTYQDTPLPLEGIQTTQDLWAAYARRMLQNIEDMTKCSPSLSANWLGLLARQMQARKQNAFSPESIQPDWLPPRQRAISWGSIWLFRVLAGGLGVVAFITLFSLPWWLVLGLPIVLLFSLVGWLLESDNDKTNLRRLNAEAWTSLIGGILAVALIWWIYWWLKDTFGFVLTGLPLYALGFIFGLTGFQLFKEQFADLDATARRSIMRFWLARSEAFPLRDMSFLAYATKCHLLKPVRGGYSFVHPTLMRHFADLPPSNEPADAPA